MSINRYPILLLLSVVKWVSSNKSNAAYLCNNIKQTFVEILKLTPWYSANNCCVIKLHINNRVG